MNLRQMQVFKAIMESGTVTGAAERLAVSQPAVSKQLRHLERQLGFPIFERVSGRLVPTGEARALYEEVERVSAGLDDLARFAEDLKAMRRGRLVVGALPMLSTRWLPHIVGRFVQARPDIVVNVETCRSVEIVDWVAARQYDVGLVVIPAERPGVQQELLMRLDVVCLLPRGHRLASRRVIAATDLQDETFVALSSVDRNRLATDQVLEKAGVHPRARAQAFMTSAACALVSEGVGIALVDVLSAAENADERVVVRPFEPHTALDIMLVRPIDSRRSELAAAFVDELKREVQASQPGRARAELFRD